MANILIVDDNQGFVESFTSEVSRLGHHPIWAETLSGGLNQMESTAFDLVVLQARLPEGSSLEALPRIAAAPPNPEIIVIDDERDPQDGEAALANGAWEYLKRPSNLDALKKTVAQALEYRRVNGNRNGKQPIRKLVFDGVLGESPKARITTEILTHAASSDAPVLVLGETGTGKELFARAIHDNSLRASKNFVVLDCAALPETLVESTLFGHTKGAYTGASNAHDGLMKQANGGTLFLDEIGELPVQVQTSFLRVLETNRFRPVGGGKEIYSDFRIVAATNQNLDQAVNEKRFRKDLLYRLRTFTLELPPLRERVEDIPLIVDFHLKELCAGYDLEPKRVSDEFLQSLVLYDWPGNIREMVNALERSLIAARDENVLFSKHLPINIRMAVSEEKSGDGRAGTAVIQRDPTRQIDLPTLYDVREAAKARAEKNYLEELMPATDGNIQLACKVADVSRSRLYGLLRKHGVAINRSRNGFSPEAS